MTNFGDFRLTVFGQFNPTLTVIEKSTEDVVLHLDSNKTKNKWIVVDFSDKFEERYGIYIKKASDEYYHPFNQVKAITNVLNLISSFETKKQK